MHASSVNKPAIVKTIMLTDKEESDLIAEWIKTKDSRLLIRLVVAFEPLVLKFARKFSSYGISKEELISVGNLALCETVDRFKPELGYKFSTYATHWINGMMLIFIASNYFSFTLKSQKIKKIFFTIRREMMKAQTKNRDFNPEQIMTVLASKFDCSVQQLEQICAMIRQPHLSLDEPVSSSKNEGESTTFGETIPSDGHNPEEHLMEQSVNDYRRELIYSNMDRVLNEREKKILTGQLLMEKDQERTLQDLAEEFKCSRERVRQIRNNAFSKLEKAIRNRCGPSESRNFL